MNKYMKNPETISAFFTQGVTYFLPKKCDSKNPAKQRPIACLSTAYKIFTACLAKKIQEHVARNNIITEEQKECRKNAYGCKEQLVIDQLILELTRKNSGKLSTCLTPGS
jgi:hypothetical protein